MPDGPLRVMADTNVLVSRIISPSGARGLPAGLTEEQLLRELEEDRRALYRETYGATAPA